jgi:inner membrane protein
VDVIGFSFGIEYGDLLGHRGFTHSFLFALILGCFVGLVFFNGFDNVSRRALIPYFSLVTASHGMLDAMTDGGLGVAFFSPFKNTRYFFPWRPIKVSPLNIGSFFSPRGVEVMISEIKWIWIPTLVCVIAVWLYRNWPISKQDMK